VFTAVITPAGTGNVVLNVAAAVAKDGTNNDNTAAPQVTVTQTDDVAPMLTTVTIVSDNANTSQAKEGDEITVSITSDEVLATAPTVKIAGLAAFVAGSGTSFTAKLTVTGATPTGLASIEISGFADAAGNMRPTVTSVTDGSSVNVDTMVPTVEIQDVPTGYNGVVPFDVKIVFSEKVINFVVGDITVGNGSASNLLSADGITYTVTITPTGAGDITIDVATAVATDEAGYDNTAADQVVIGNTTVADTHKVIASFMLNRANHILANQPSLISFLNGANSPGEGELGNLSLNANEENMNLAFSSSLSKIDREANARISKLAQDRIAMAFTDHDNTDKNIGIDAVNTLKAYDATQTRNYDIWTEIYGARGTSNGSDSSLWVGYLGAHYILSPSLLIGAPLQVDWADETNASVGSTVDGTGWMLGPYMAGRVVGSTISL